MAKTVSAAEVRAWGRQQNAEHDAAFTGVAEGTRGRLSPALVEAFNKGRKIKYVEGKRVPKTATVAVPTGKGNRTRKVEVNVAEVRAKAAEAGRSIGKRGRIPSAVLLDFAQGNL